MADRAAYIITSSGTQVHKKAQIIRPELLQIGGGCLIHQCQLNCAPRMSIGQKVTVGAGTVLKPCNEPMLIGDNVSVGSRCHVEARLIGSGVVLEDGVVVGPRCTLHDGVRVTKDSVVPPDTFAAPGTVLHGCPAIPIAALHS